MLFTVLLALFFVALFAAVITLYNRADMMKDASTSDTMKLEAVGETLNDIDNSWSETEDNLVGNYVAEATIASMALRDVIKEEGDQAIAAYSSGAVIKVEGGKLTAPDGIDRTYGLTADLFIGNSGLLDAPADSSTMLAYSKIMDLFCTRTAFSGIIRHWRKWDFPSICCGIMSEKHPGP